MLWHPVIHCKLEHTLRSHDLSQSVTQFRLELKACHKEGGKEQSEYLDHTCFIPCTISSPP